jgi:hypothetical protein
MEIGRFRIDISGLLLALGFLGLAVWLIRDGHLLAVPSLVFSLWWGWHALHDHPVALNIKNAPVAPPEPPSDPFHARCCFCGAAVSSDHDDYCSVDVNHRGEPDRWQAWWCHGSCFKERLAAPTDAPDLFAPRFF